MLFNRCFSSTQSTNFQRYTFVLSPSLLTAFAILCDWLKIVSSYGSPNTETHAPRHYSVDLVYFWNLVINRILTNNISIV